jgi:glutathione S-transferase
MGDITIFGIAVPVALIIWYVVVRSLMGYLRYDRDRKRQEYQQKQEWYARMEEDPLMRTFVRAARKAQQAPPYSTYSSDKPTHIRMSGEDR